jgi:hypothetical protein
MFIVDPENVTANTQKRRIEYTRVLVKLRATVGRKG